MELKRKDQMFFSVMKSLYSHGGYLPLTKLADLLKLDIKSASKFAYDYPNYFKVVHEDEENPSSDDSNVFVLGITEATFCVKHASKTGSCLGCDSLHVCKFFALGDRCKFGDSCNFCHSFTTVHNRRVLKKYHLLQLDEPELKCLFQKIENRCDVTTPKICKFFNNDSCNKTDCICLHICKYYLTNECMYGKKCRINHDVDKRNIEILNMYGIAFSSISDALSKLRILYNINRQIKSTDDEKAEICLHYLSSKGCAFNNTCRYQHEELPYQWRYRMKNALGDIKWNNFDLSWNEKIEKKFCNLEDETHISGAKNSVAKFQFNTMKCFLAKQEYVLDRLSTVSYKSDSRSPLATTWIWYWKDNDIWIEYGSSSSNSIDVTNEDIEKNYLENPNGTMVIQIIGRRQIKINFNKMVQKGKRKREIINRPRFISSKDAKTLRQQSSMTSKSITTPNEMQPSNFPLNWEVPNDIAELSSHFNISEVEKESNEYESVSDQFYHSMRKASITKIERIENGNLWENYDWKKKKMIKERSSDEDVQELNLFHGTDLESIDAICKQGFDVRLSGIGIGSKYGKGIYFSRDSAFANNYIIPVDGEYKVFLANVLTGDFVSGKPTYVRPPQKNSDEKGGKLYDSCVDNITEPKLYVVFANEQAYPAYMITYNVID